ncbi:hypothetical protein F2P81_022390 [Scophthalmus maximus]|uniref:Uncharacterized protein n=1 Tax=Scophthalmus maximus TaxID=52904 RepID=A0A6A4RYY1_SCOMX|nr:hypothetical protein F2P81_022390 [Scophthalmus maximus]
MQTPESILAHSDEKEEEEEQDDECTWKRVSKKAQLEVTDSGPLSLSCDKSSIGNVEGNCSLRIILL